MKIDCARHRARPRSASAHTTPDDARAQDRRGAPGSAGRRGLAVVLAVLGLLHVGALLRPVPAQVLQTGRLGVERRGHTATLLRDGRILVAGGQSQAGPLASSELIDPATGVASAGPDLDARVDHAATLLGNGRVLITGGQGAAGPLASSQIFDPASNTFSAGPAMARARAGHGLTVLRDGRVLASGGDTEGTAEVFDPAAGAFALLDQRLRTPRAFHGTAVLADGKVLLAGGARADGTLLQTAETFEPSTQTFAAISRPMAVPRFAPALAVLADGKVQIIGGDDASTMEMYDPGSRLFNAIVHLPPSSGLLAETLRSRTRAALFTTSADGNPALAGAPADTLDLLDREDHTLTDSPSAGRAVVAGGIDQAGRVSATIAVFESSPAQLTTDALDYAPGRTVTITGSGWQPGETVTLVIREEPETHPDTSLSVSADAQGAFTSQDFAPAPSDAGRTFSITAVGLSSGRNAQTAFSDNVGVNLDQCRNGTLANIAVPCGTNHTPTPPNWENGDVNQSNSQYREGDGLPYRLTITSLDSGTWTIRLAYDFTKGGIYALDRLTRDSLTQASDPCLDNPDITCAVGSPAFTFVMPGEVVTPSVTQPALANGGALVIAGSASRLTAADDVMTVWADGGTATFVSTGQNWTGSQSTSFNDGSVLQNGSAAGDSSREFAFKVSLSGCPAGGCTLLLGWTGHIASAVDWGSGEGAASITGSPFHMSVVGVDQADGTKGGSQDRSAKLDKMDAPGTIVIKKVTDPASDTTTVFGFTASGPTISPSAFTLKNGDSETFINVTAGTYTVTESSVPAGWALSNLTCVDPSSDTTTSVGTATATIAVAAGETVTCTFTNSQTGKIVVKKVTDPASDTTTSFSFTASGGLTPTSFSLKNGDTQTFDGVAPNVPSGSTYAVSESSLAGWTLTSATCDNGSAVSNIKVKSGETVTCTFTNTQGASIVIKKVTDPASDTTTLFGFTASGGLSPASFSLKNGQSQTFTGVAPNVPSGATYAVSESSPPPGWTLSTATCDNGSALSNIKVKPGDNVTCTFTNTGRGTIVVKKETVPGSDTTTMFGFTASGGLSPTSFSLKNGESRTFTGVVPGAGYGVSESSVPANWHLDSATCDDGSPVSNIDVSAGETVTCTFKNSLVSPGPPRLIVIKHVVNNASTNNHAADFSITVSGTAVAGGTTSFPGAEAPGTTVSVSAGTYTVTESGPANFSATFAGDCTNVTIADGQTKTCTITNTAFRPAPATFCSKAPVTSLLTSTRIANNKGIDNLVRVDLGQSIQAAVDAATDTNNDGYIIIGVIAGPGSPGPYGGNTTQRVTISQAYGKPFALVGCSVTMHDPNRGDGLPTGLVTASASSPTSAKNPASILVVDLHGADSEVAGWKIDGVKREFVNVNASGNALGLWVTASSSTIRGSAVQNNQGVGVLVQGSSNILDTVSAYANGGHGFQVTGNTNQLLKANSGDVSKGNGGDGVNVSGTGNVLSETSAFANAGHGIAVTGAGTQILKGFAGDKGKGNAGDGIRAASSGNLLQDNRANANRGDGFNVSGGSQASANSLKNNQSNTGAAGANTENGQAEYRLLNYVTSGGANKADNIAIPKTSSPVKCPAFPATGQTVNFTSVSVCE